jgi:8-oxo-dGTP pyrophosphatase MutT (NUDIX family)
MEILEFRKELADALRSRNFSELDGTGARKGAVLIILYPEGDDVNIIFTVRSQNVPTHKGEISFPGGGYEPWDSDLIDTALRETHEEIDLEVHREQVLGRLDDYSTSASKFVVAPFVAFLDSKPEVRPDSFEVAEILHVPLSCLLAPGAPEEGIIMSRVGELKVPIFRYGEYKIWGATQKMLSGFIGIIKEFKSLQDP